MAEDKGQKVKVYMVIGLAIFAGVFAYFRFYYKKAPTVSTAASEATVSPATDLRVPRIDFKSMRKPPSAAATETKKKGTGIRDVFSSLSVLNQFGGGAEPEEEEAPLPTFTLSGTILGGGAPIAVINSQFLREGDEIDGYQVVKIGKNDVRLRSVDQVLVLEVLATAENQ